MRECKARGERVEDRLRLAAGETEDDGARTFDRGAEVTIAYIRKLIMICANPNDAGEIEAVAGVADDVVRAIRTTFQAHITYLRWRLKVEKAFTRFWSDPEQLAHDPALLSVFEDTLATEDPTLARTVVADLHRRFPSRPRLVKP